MLSSSISSINQIFDLPILTALIAGAFGLITLHINKKNKISEFRQTWIDGLREDIANLAGLARTISSSLSESRSNLEHIDECKEKLKSIRERNKNLKASGHSAQMIDMDPWQKELDRSISYEDGLVKDDSKDLEEFRKYYYRILLRLNLGDNKKFRAEERHGQISEALDKIVEYINPSETKEFDFNKSLVLIEDFVCYARLALKEEWTRVKIGEFRYKTKRFFKRN